MLSGVFHHSLLGPERTLGLVTRRAPGVGWGPCVAAPAPLQEAPSTEAGLSESKSEERPSGPQRSFPVMLRKHNKGKWP